MGFIRILLALSIVIHHSYPLFGISILGRDPALHAFYIISGFYMALIINEKYINKNSSYCLFISNRFLRIFPTYWFILLLTYIFNYIFLNVNILTQTPFYILRDLTLIIRIDYLQLSTNLREPITIVVAYTLVLELYFYLLAPLVAKLKSKTLIPIITISFIIHFLVFLILRLIKQPIGDWFFPEVMIYFFLGIFSYKLYQIIKNINFNIRLFYLLYIFIIFITIFYTKFPDFHFFRRCVDINEWIYLTVICLSIPIIFKNLKDNRIDRFVGELSYPVYLSHLLIFSILSQTMLIKQNSNFIVIIFIIITIVFSIITYHIIEKPIEVIRQRRIKRVHA